MGQSCCLGRDGAKESAVALKMDFPETEKKSNNETTQPPPEQAQDSANAELTVLTITGDVVVGPMPVSASMTVERVREIVALAWRCTPAAVLLTDGCAQLSDEFTLVEFVGIPDGAIVVTAAMLNFEQIYSVIIDGLARVPLMPWYKPFVRPAARWKSLSARVKLKLERLALDARMEHLPSEIHLWLQILFASATSVEHRGFQFNPDAATLDLDTATAGAVNDQFCTLRAAPGGIVCFSISFSRDDVVLYMVDCNGELAKALFDREGNRVVALVDDDVDVLAEWEPYDVEFIVADSSHAMRIMEGRLPNVEDVAPHLGISRTAAGQFGLRSWGLGSFTDSEGKVVSMAQYENVKWPVTWKRTMTSPSKPAPGAVWHARVENRQHCSWRQCENAHEDFLTPSFWRDVRDVKKDPILFCQLLPRPVAPSVTAFFTSWAETGVLPM